MHFINKNIGNYMSKKLYILSILSLILVFNVNAKDIQNTKSIQNTKEIAEMKEAANKKMKKEMMKKRREGKQIEGYKVKFEEIDKGGKGYLTEKAYMKYHNKGWKLIDKVVSSYALKSEVLEACKKENGCNTTFKEKEFDLWDFNKDGKITKEEHELRRKVEFAKMDKNSDNKITKEEYEEAISFKFKANKKGNGGKVKEKYKMEIK